MNLRTDSFNHWHLREVCAEPVEERSREPTDSAADSKDRERRWDSTKVKNCPCAESEGCPEDCGDALAHGAGEENGDEQINHYASEKQTADGLQNRRRHGAEEQNCLPREFMLIERFMELLDDSLYAQEALRDGHTPRKILGCFYKYECQEHTNHSSTTPQDAG